MSLTSWIFDCFNFFAPNPLTPTDGRGSIGLVEGGEYGGVRDDSSLQLGRRKQNAAMEKQKQEGRPPYLHVRPAKRCWRAVCETFDHLMADCGIVYASWRHWRDDGRSPNAFT